MMDEDVMPEGTEMARPVRPKRKYRRRRSELLRTVKEPDEFPGLTVFKCCDTCGPRCIITEAGTGLCAHPAKAALQHPDMMDPKVLAKYQRAKLELQKQQAENKLKKMA